MANYTLSQDTNYKPLTIKRDIGWCSFFVAAFYNCVRHTHTSLCSLSIKQQTA